MENGSVNFQWKIQLLLLSEDHLAGGDDRDDLRLQGGDGNRLNNIHIHCCCWDARLRYASLWDARLL